MSVALFLIFVGVATAIVVGSGQGAAMPMNPKDESKVPHYFGPYPNYANSQFTLPDVTVTIVGDGTGAAATATVGPNGAITGIDILDPGQGYTAATVAFAGAGTGASATAAVNGSGAVTAVALDVPGAGYKKPNVSFSGGAGTGAAATVYGGVDSLILTNEGAGYSFPTVDFDLPDDPNGIQAKAHVELDATTGAVTQIIIDSAGSGYSSAPNVVIRDGTIFSPVAHDPAAFAEATAKATISLASVTVDSFGTGYTAAPDVTITDTVGTGSGATATATVDVGSIASITLDAGGTGYITAGGIKKFQDGLPQLCDPSLGCTDNNLGQHIPLAVPDATTFTTANGFAADADYYVIGLVQHREQMSSSLPAQGTLLREYVQLETPSNASWSKHVPLSNDLLNGTSVAVKINGVQAYAVDDPHYMGPIIQAQKDRAVRIVFYNLLPTGKDGDLFIPVDTTFMGSGMGPMDMTEPMDRGTVLDMVRNPMCGETTKNRMDCFSDTRASIHLHGGITPWISDGSPHQWITPANEQTMWPEGVAVSQVPDMVGTNLPAGVPECSADDDGCTTFYYTNQQSARLMFYHDHAWGITRLNVYAGEAAGYIIRDDTEQALIDSGLLPSGADEIPLVIQDKTFLPSTEQVAAQDPTWDYNRWGSEGDLWYEHVYMPAQNPGDPSGMSAFGRWMYGPWFWPPATPTYGPIDNPYYDPNCDLDDSTTWQYQTEPYCEPATIPGTPNNSAGMEQFNDTPVVNGTAYPTTTVEPKAYRLRILNAANDRFWNLQWYVADPTTGTDSEVALKAAELLAAQTDPNFSPRRTRASAPRDRAGSRSARRAGFFRLRSWCPTSRSPGSSTPPALTWATSTNMRCCSGRPSVPTSSSTSPNTPARHSSFTTTLRRRSRPGWPVTTTTPELPISARWARPALCPAMVPTPVPSCRSRWRTARPAPAYNLTALKAAFKHKADGSGVFESGQNPIIVGQAAYNSAYGTSFASAGWCNNPSNPSAKCDGFARISEQGGETFKFDTLMGNQIGVKIEPKAIHDETNATDFEPYGRMSGNIGVEAVPATPAAQNIVLYPFVNPPTELFDATEPTDHRHVDADSGGR